MDRLILFSVLLFFFVACGCAADPEAVNCKELGFNSDLLCSRCAELKDFIDIEKTPAIYDECMTCCTKDKESDLEKVFVSAKLLLDDRRLLAFPHLQGFIRSAAKSKEFPGFKYVPSRGMYTPKLKLTDEDGSVTQLRCVGGGLCRFRRSKRHLAHNVKNSKFKANHFASIDNWKGKVLKEFLQEKLKAK